MSGRGTGIEEVTLADTQVITEQEDSQQQQADVIPAKTKKVVTVCPNTICYVCKGKAFWIRTRTCVECEYKLCYGFN